MVSESVTALVGVVGSLVGYGVAGMINLRSTNEQIEAQQEQLETRLQAQKEQLESRQEAENERRHAEFYLGRKVEALTDLHAELHNCRHEYRVKDDTKGQGISEEDMQELITAYDNFREAADAASIYLTEDQIDKIEKFREVLAEANSYFDIIKREGTENALGVTIPDEAERYWDRMEFFDAHDKAKSVLKAEINEPIRRFEAD